MVRHLRTTLLVALALCLSIRAEDGISSYEVEIENESSSVPMTEGTMPSERGAVYGHSPLSANPKERYMEPLSLSSSSPMPSSSSNDDYLLDPPAPTFLNNPPVDTTFRGAPLALDPAKGLDHLDYIADLLENYPTCDNKCDASVWNGCTCAYPATYSEDGRGNCNVGATKQDLKVWCYVDASRGNPLDLCPDAKPSKTMPGYYWSRIACITD